MERKFPRANFKTEPGELDLVFAFAGPEHAVAEELGVSVTTYAGWTAKRPYPRRCSLTSN
jgi:hypothetical protein